MLVSNSCEAHGMRSRIKGRNRLPPPHACALCRKPCPFRMVWIGQLLGNGEEKGGGCNTQSTARRSLSHDTAHARLDTKCEPTRNECAIKGRCTQSYMGHRDHPPVLDVPGLDFEAGSVPGAHHTVPTQDAIGKGRLEVPVAHTSQRAYKPQEELKEAQLSRHSPAKQPAIATKLQPCSQAALA